MMFLRFFGGLVMFFSIFLRYSSAALDRLEVFSRLSLWSLLFSLPWSRADCMICLLVNSLVDISLMCSSLLAMS
jgi:hypothetical protein